MKTIQRLFLLILLLQLAACRPKQNAQISMDTLVNSQVCSIVDDYSAHHPQYKSLIFVTDFEYHWKEGENVILLGPSLERLPLREGLYPTQVFHYKDKLIFIQSSSGPLYENSDIQTLYKQNSIKIKRKDDIIFFMEEAAVYKGSKIGNLRKVSNRADSVIMRKREIWQAPPIVRFPYTR